MAVKLMATLTLATYLINVQIGLPSALVLFISCSFMILCFLAIRKKCSLCMTALSLMCISIPFSWNPIWGGAIGDSQITWFYLWMLVFVAIQIIEIIRKGFLMSKSFMILSSLLLLASVVPLIMSHSIGQGIKEYVMISFFVIIAIITYGVRIVASEDEVNYVIDIYIYVMFCMAIGMILQFIAYRFLGLKLFGFQAMYSYNDQIQTGCHLLMEDPSSGTVMLGIGVLFCLMRLPKRKMSLLTAAIIATGLACSGRRTGIYTLMIIFAAFLIVRRQNILEKTRNILILAAVSGLLFIFINLSRPADTLVQMLDDNGRFKLWQEGISIFLKRPILGYGYDNEYITSLMPSQMIVHNTLIRWFDMGGVVLGLLLISFCSYIFLFAVKSGRKETVWAYAYTLLSAMLIPDIMNARFVFVLIPLITICYNNAHCNMYSDASFAHKDSI